MRIGELGKLAHTPTVTLRYYEKIGLLPNNKRSVSNYRVYDDSDIETLRFVKHCRNHQISIEDTKKLLELREGKTENWEEATRIVNAHIKKMKAQIKSTEELIASLKSIIPRGADKAAKGRKIVETLGKPCPKCADYQQKIKELEGK